jgi:hypothetical protein
MAKPKQERAATTYDERPLQYRDLSSEGKGVIDVNMAQWGRAKSGAAEIKQTLTVRGESAAASAADESLSQEKRDSAERTKGKVDKSVAALAKVEPHLKDANVTIATARNRRTTLVKQSADRASREAPNGLGGGSRLRAAGAGWYFDHRGELNSIASEHGLSEEAVVTGSAVMSPNNSPSNEKAAIGALAHLHKNNPTLNFTPEGQKALGLASSSARFHDLTADQASKIGHTDIREHVSGVDAGVLTNLSKGGTNKNIAKAVDVLRGNIHHDEAINPHSSPKVWSYRDSIRKSQPGTAEHEEYLGRAQTAMFEMPGQQRMDLFGLKDSTKGILDPTKSTAEDTWQGAISSGQQFASLGSGRQKISPAKFIASDKASTDRIKKTTIIDGKRKSAVADPRIGSNAVTHAWHNEATIQAAGVMSRRSGEIIPATLPQEVGWTEARRRAGKDDDYTEFKGRNSHFASGHQKQIPGQTSLF